MNHIQGKTVYLYLIARRFKCQCTTFHLMNLIIDSAESRSATGMNRVLKELGILVKKSSL